MGHKTLIGGTSYDLSGGKTLVSGTSYSVQGGKVLVNGTAYDISFFLPPAALDLWSGNASDTINCIAYANGYWVVGGVHYESSKYYARIAYATSPDGPWTTKDLWTNCQYSNDGVSCITYANGYWVAGGRNYTYAGMIPTAYIKYAASLDGTWYEKTISTNTNKNGVTFITYADGYWVASLTYSNGTQFYAEIAYNNNASPSGSWHTETFSNWFVTINSIIYANGYWVVSGNSNSNSFAKIAYGTSLSSMTLKQIGIGSNSHVVYGNGYWVVTAGNKVYFSTSPDGTYSSKTILNDSTSSTSIFCITYANGYFVAGGQYYDGSSNYAVIAYATKPDGTWTVINLLSGNGDDLIRSVIYAGDYWLAGGQKYDGSTYSAHLEYSPTLDGFEGI